MIYYLGARKHTNAQTGKTSHFVRLFQADGFGVWGHVDYYVAEGVYNSIAKQSLFPGVPVLVSYAIGSGYKGNTVSLQSLRIDEAGVPLDLVADTE